MTDNDELGSVPFNELNKYRNVLKKLLANNLSVEHRGF